MREKGKTLEEISACVTRYSCEAFGKCGKFAGAATVEIIKKALADEALPASVRDVFIQGLPVEWDLVVPRPSGARGGIHRSISAGVFHLHGSSDSPTDGGSACC